MKIIICGSMSSAQKMVQIRDELLKFNHEVILPRHAQEYALCINRIETMRDSVKNKIEKDLIRDYFKEISGTEAVLIINIEKNGIKDYIGGNAFLEMGFAHVLKKKIFLLNSIPQMIYTDEIMAMQPIELGGDLFKINSKK